MCFQFNVTYLKKGCKYYLHTQFIPNVVSLSHIFTAVLTVSLNQRNTESHNHRGRKIPSRSYSSTINPATMIWAKNLNYLMSWMSLFIRECVRVENNNKNNWKVINVNITRIIKAKEAIYIRRYTCYSFSYSGISAGIISVTRLNCISE